MSAPRDELERAARALPDEITLTDTDGNEMTLFREGHHPGLSLRDSDTECRCDSMEFEFDRETLFELARWALLGFSSYLKETDVDMRDNAARKEEADANA